MKIWMKMTYQTLKIKKISSQKKKRGNPGGKRGKYKEKIEK